MTRGEKYLQFLIAETDDIIFVQKLQFRVIIDERQLPHLPGRGAILQYRFLERVQVQLQPVSIVNEFIPENVIEVAVGVQQQDRCQP